MTDATSVVDEAKQAEDTFLANVAKPGFNYGSSDINDFEDWYH
jgi:hypothetical protein